MSQTRISQFKLHFNLVDYVMSVSPMQREYRSGVFILCPFHRDNNPSLFVEHDRWRCFGCGEYGDSIDFLVKTGAVGSISEAVGGEFGSFIESKPVSRRATERRYVRPNARILERMHRNLMSSPANQKKLNDRGISLKSMMEYKIGYGKLPWSQGRAPRFSIPFFDRSGKVVTAKFRRDDSEASEDEYKYVSWPNTRSYLYNVDRLGSSSKVLYCGGQFDSIIWNQVGACAVGPSSETMFQDSWASSFEGREVSIILDNDDAGRAWSKKVNEKIPWAKALEWPSCVPDGYDASDVFLKMKDGVDILMELANA